MSLFRSELEEKFTKISPPAIVVNTWKTKRQPWNVANVRIYSIEFLEEIKELVISLPVRVRIPENVSELSFPRYYAIYRDEHSQIREVVGVRNDLTATKWSYRFGYWHPKIQELIAKAIERELKELRESRSSEVIS